MSNFKSLLLAIFFHLLIGLVINFSSSKNDTQTSFKNLSSVSIDSFSITHSQIASKEKFNFQKKNSQKNLPLSSPSHELETSNLKKDTESFNSKMVINQNSDDSKENFMANSQSISNGNISEHGGLDGDNEGVFNNSINEYRKPIYPRLAIKQNLEGAVKIEATVNSFGKILDVKIVQSSGHKILDDAAVSAVLLWTLKPTNKVFTFTKTIRFKLN